MSSGTVRSRGQGAAASLLLIYAAWFSLRWGGMAWVVGGVLSVTALGLLRRWPLSVWLAMACAAVASMMWILMLIIEGGSGRLTSHWSRLAGAIIGTGVWLSTWGFIGMRAWRMRPSGPNELIEVEVFD